MINPFIDRAIILKEIDSKYYSSDNLITELLLYLNKLDTNLCPSFKDIFSSFEEMCYNSSRENKSIFSKKIKNGDYCDENIYYDDQHKTIFSFEKDGGIVVYILKKDTNQVIIDNSIYHYIICDLIEDCITEISV